MEEFPSSRIHDHPRPSSLFDALTMDIDGLAGHAILFGKHSNALSESKIDSLYLFSRQRRLSAALIVGITLTGEKDAHTLSLSSYGVQTRRPSREY